MFKKGQITIFIILGIAIILTIGVTLVITNKSPVENEMKKTTAGRLEIAPIQNLVNDCLNTVAMEGVRKISMRGGFINPKGEIKYGEFGDGFPSKLHYFFGGQTLPYLFFEKKSNLMPIDNIKAKLENYLIIEMQNCLDFNSFVKKGFVIKQPDIKQLIQETKKDVLSVNYSSVKINANVIFNDDAIIVALQYPLVFERDSVKTIISDFSVSLPLRFKLVYAIAQKLLSANLLQKYELNKHCKEYASNDNLINIYVKDNKYDYDSVIQIIDAKPKLQRNELPLKFQFATRNAMIKGDCVG